MKKTLVFAALAGVLILAFGGTAFAAYGQTFTMPSTLTPGSTVVINPTFTKDTGDAGPVYSHYFEVRVTGANAQSGVVGVPDGNWWPPVPTASGPGFSHFASNEFITWVGNVGTLNPPPPSLRFDSAGTYAVEIRLCPDTATYPSPTWLQSSTYNVVVAAPPVASVPASSPWTIALLAIGALGMLVFIGRSRLTA